MSLLFALVLVLGSEPLLQTDRLLSPRLTVSGERVADRFGDSVFFCSDLDDDGYQEFLVSAPAFRGRQGPLSGAVFLFGGSDGEVLHEWQGENAFQRFGKSVVVLESTGEDPLRLLVGAPYWGPDDQQAIGKVYLLAYPDPGPPETLTGQQQGDLFGYSLTQLDFDGDGLEEIVVGAPGFEGSRGRVWIFSGFDRTPLGTLQGKEPGDSFGYALDSGDLDGDGFSDLLVTAPGTNGPAGLETGRVYLFSGVYGHLLGKVDGCEPGTRLGLRCACLPDLDGDDLPEIAAVGRQEEGFGCTVFSGMALDWGYTLPQPYAGLPLVLKDQNEDGAPELLLAAAEPDENLILYSGRNGERLGHWALPGEPVLPSTALALSSLADPSGFQRLAVADQPFAFQGNEAPGQVMLCPVQPPGMICRLQGERAGEKLGAKLELLGKGPGEEGFFQAFGLPNASGAAGAQTGCLHIYSEGGGAAEIRIEGTEAGAMLGESLLAVPDMDGDDRPDLLVTAPGFSRQRGAVYLYSSAEGKFREKKMIGEEPGDRLGADLVLVGDLTGNGLPDFAVSAPGGKAGEKLLAGMIYLVEAETFKVIESFKGRQENARLGMILESVDDLEGDGLADLLCTERIQKNTDWIRRIRAFGSAKKGHLYNLEGTEAGLNFGASMLGIHDLDRDGVYDLAVGAPALSAEEGTISGRVYLYSGKTGEPLGAIMGQVAESSFGQTLGLIRDLDGDGLGDLVISSSNGTKEILYLYGSTALQPLHILVGEEPRSSFGFSVAGAVHPWNGDGVDLLVGAPLQSRPRAAGSGAAFAYRLALSPPGTHRSGPAFSWISLDKGLEVNFKILFVERTLFLLDSPSDPLIPVSGCDHPIPWFYTDRSGLYQRLARLEKMRNKIPLLRFAGDYHLSVLNHGTFMPIGPLSGPSNLNPIPEK